MRSAKVYGYCRISTMKQNIERQIANIKAAYPDAVIISESFTGTKIDRPAFSKLLKNIHAGDTIVFDEVSRMSRNAQEGIDLYTELFEKGVNLVFLKERYIDTEVYREKLKKQADKISGTGNEATDKLLNNIMDALHEYTLDLAREQIQRAFETAQAEVDFLHQRTSEGVRRAQAEGKQVGRLPGSKLETKKSIQVKEIIRKHSKDFEGTLSDIDVIKLAGCSRNSYYKYKRELSEV